MKEENTPEGNSIFFNEDTKPVYSAVSEISSVLSDGRIPQDEALRLLDAMDQLVRLLARWNYIR